MKIKKNKYNFIISMLFILAFSFLGINFIADTNSQYKTTSNSETDFQVAPWNFTVNGSESGTLNVSLTSNNKVVVPGMSGSIPLVIDATGTKVAIEYTITINRDNLPKNLKFYSDSAYSQEITSLKGQIELGDPQKITKNIYWKWIYTTENETNEWSDKPMNLTLSVSAKQKVEGDV